MTDPPLDYDVAILGGGNAALCAALTAREAGRSVVVVEAAPRHMRGGNSRHTRNLRCAHGAPTAVLGLVLGPLAELQFRRALAISEGNPAVFVTRPLCASLLAVSAVALVLPALFKARRV